MSTDGEDPPKSGEVLDGDHPPPPNEGNWLAFVSSYTERPDLFLAEIEKNDPGFTKRMNEAGEARAERTETARFHFSKRQAYTALGVSAAAGGVVLIALLIGVVNGTAGFGTIIALGVFFAITQGGTSGFTRIIDMIPQLFGRGKNDRDE